MRIVKEITRHIRVDDQGSLHIFWEEGEKEQILPDLDTAIRQEEHVLENYLGLQVKINNEILRLPGETQKMRGISESLLEIIGQTIQPSLTPQEQRKIDTQITAIIKEIGAVRNPFKQMASQRLRDSSRITSLPQAIGVSEAQLDILRRLEDIAKKAKGVWQRRKILLAERRRVEQIIISLHRALGSFLLKRSREEITLNDMEKFANRFSPYKPGLWLGLGSIKVMPYLKRISSPQIQRLLRLRKYLEERNEERFWRAIEEVLKKLQPAVEEINRRKPAPRLKTLERPSTKSRP